MRATGTIRLRIDAESKKPEAIDEVDRRVIQLKIEREALKKESDAASKERLKQVEQDLADLEKRSAELTTLWRAEREKFAPSATNQGIARTGPRRIGDGAGARRSHARRRADLFRHPAAGKETRRDAGQRPNVQAGGHRGEIVIRYFQDLGVNDDSIPIILDLIDQLHGLRSVLRELLLSIKVKWRSEDRP